MKRFILLPLLTLVVAWLFPVICLAQIGKSRDFTGEFSQPEIFLRPLKLVGRTAGTGLFLVTDPASCQGLGTLDRCFVLPAQPAVLNWNEPAIESLTLPAKTLRDVLVLTVQNNIDFELENDTGSDSAGMLRSRVTLTLESPAFANVTDPSTGLPLNGAWTFGLGQRRISMTLHAGDFQSDQSSSSRRAYISRSLLKASLGMTDEQVNQFFDNPITLKVNMDGRAHLAIDSFHTQFVAIEGY